MKKFIKSILLFILCFTLAGCSAAAEDETVNTFIKNETEAAQTSEAGVSDSKAGAAEIPASKSDAAQKGSVKAGEIKISLSDIPAYSGKPYVEVNGNTPYFANDELSAVSYEYYPDLDSLGRCGTCIASIGQDIMPNEERGTIGDVRPSGWHTVKYSDIIDGNYLYNRCHLIAFQLAGENANTKNLITGTRYMNVEGMLPFENRVADYVKSSQNHVMYRVTPMFDKNNLVAGGVLIEAKSVEDSGRGLQFNVFCYNVQPGILIDYATGDSKEDESFTAQPQEPAAEPTQVQVPVEVQPPQAPAAEEAPQAPKAEEQPQEPAAEPTQMQAPVEVQPPQASAVEEAPQAPAAEEPPQIVSANKDAYVVNRNNGKIHMAGACPATGTGSTAMKKPVYFNTYEEAEAYSISIFPSHKNRRCGNCWK